MPSLPLPMIQLAARSSGRAYACRLAPLLALAWAAMGCSGDPSLEVVLQTDYEPRTEFVRVRTDLLETGRFYVHEARPTDDFADGLSLVEVEDIPRGPLSVRVRLLDASEGLVAQATEEVDVDGPTVATVELKRCLFEGGCPVEDAGTRDAGPGSADGGHCEADEDLGSDVGEDVASGSTVGGEDRVTPECDVRHSAPDVVYRWTAPDSGTWTFDTLGSDFDTVLDVRDASCRSLACNDNGGRDPTSHARVELTAGTTIFVTVDGDGSASGAFRLHIHKDVTSRETECGDGLDNDRDGQADCLDIDCMGVTVADSCPDMDLGSAIGEAVVAGTLEAGRCSGRAPESSTLCSSTLGEGGELSFTWTAPASGLYTFRTVGSEFNPIVYVNDGGCDGPQLECRYGDLSVFLEEGQLAAITLDTLHSSTAGDFVLSIDQSCPDEDEDGVTTCDGDCDDAEWLRYPGAPEVCGDGLTNDCGSAAPADGGCEGQGTFVSGSRGDDGNPGTISDPVATIGEGIANAVDIGGGGVYVAQGTYREHVTLPPGVSLYGALDDATFQPGGRPTEMAEVVEEQPLFVVAEGVTSDSVVDGIDFEHRGSAVAAAVRIEANASPVIRHMEIFAVQPVAIEVNPAGAPSSGRPRIESSFVRTGPIRVLRSGIELVDVRVGGGLFRSDSWVAVDLVETSPDTRIEGCHIRVYQGPGVRILDGSATLEGNLITSFSTPDTQVGVSVEGSPGQVRLVNNVIMASDSAADASSLIALLVAPTENDDAHLIVHSNLFVGGRGCSGRSVGVELQGSALTSPTLLGRFRNNVIDSGDCATRYAFAEDSPDLGPELFEHNALFSGGPTPPPDSALYRRSSDVSLTDIEDVNALSSRHADNLESDCDIAQGSDGIYRLPAGSTCIDAGSSREAPATDFEGDSRPQGGGYDIGPDEAT